MFAVLTPLGRFQAALHPKGHATRFWPHPPSDALPPPETEGELAFARAIARYFEGGVDALLPFAPPPASAEKATRGGFHDRVLAALHAIQPGHTLSYGALADAVGSPGAARAVGQVMQKNPVLLVVPCHRVVPSSGGVGNYRAGAEAKGWLLAHEAEHGRRDFSLSAPSQAQGQLELSLATPGEPRSPLTPKAPTELAQALLTDAVVTS